ncbi:MAG: Serine phosphatase RsbU regulator of sigma subunit-like protein [Streptosporangiaceae bacterium]|nr:Serine phosphatase RsbU regulator of sigma subunit-like protein [Streptosporangiaceae bacterium]
MKSVMARKGEAPTTDSASRTLVLGINNSGQIVQCGQNVQSVLGREPGDVLGLHLGEIIDDAKEQLDALLEAVRSGQERRAVLPLKRADDSVTDAVVTAQPMVVAGPHLAALIFIGVALQSSERFQDPALMRRSLMDDPLTRFGTTLDLDQTAKALIDVIVPHFCTTATLVVLESLVAADEVHGEATDGAAVLRRLALASDDGNPMWSSTFPVGEVLVYPKDTPYRKCLDTAKPVHLPVIDDEAARKIARKWRRKPVAELLSGASLVLLPVISKDTLLGILVCTRIPGFRRFDAYDVEIGMEFAARAAIVLDNARRFSLERATALTLQRSLLPISLSAPSTVEVRHRYLPGSKLVEVGGDWYESIALPGARVALIVGDVAGHGVKAAVTMGRLRTALHTLANLELPPAQALHVMHELMVELGEQEPHFATCVYAVYDATTGNIEIASAGHLPPLLAHPDGSNELLEIPPAPPLGVEGGATIESREFTVEDGSLFVIYTDGLVESRGRDIDDGLARLRGVFDAEAHTRPMEDLCKATLAGVYDDEHRDDIAVLIARLRRLPEDLRVSWSLPADPAAVRRARGHVRTQLGKWGLEELSYSTELLASELITNALRYAPGPIDLRLLKERTLICEVMDRSAALPLRRHAADDEETGRGLLVISQFAQRWGTRRTATGKVVWCEQHIPGVDPSPAQPAGLWPGELHHR